MAAVGRRSAARLVVGGVWICGRRSSSCPTPTRASARSAPTSCCPRGRRPRSATLLPVLEIVVGRLPGARPAHPRRPRWSRPCCWWPSSSASPRSGRAGITIDCGCFGGGGPTRDATASTPGRSPATWACCCSRCASSGVPRTPSPLDNLLLPPSTRPRGHDPMSKKHRRDAPRRVERPPRRERSRAAASATPAHAGDRRRGRRRAGRGRRRPGQRHRDATTRRPPRDAGGHAGELRRSSSATRPRAAQGGRLRGLPVPVLRRVRGGHPGRRSSQDAARARCRSSTGRSSLLPDRLLLARPDAWAVVLEQGTPGAGLEVPRPALRRTSRRAGRVTSPASTCAAGRSPGRPA